MPGRSSASVRDRRHRADTATSQWRSPARARDARARRLWRDGRRRRRKVNGETWDEAAVPPVLEGRGGSSAPRSSSTRPARPWSSAGWIVTALNSIGNLVERAMSFGTLVFFGGVIDEFPGCGSASATRAATSPLGIARMDKAWRAGKEGIPGSRTRRSTSTIRPAITSRASTARLLHAQPETLPVPDQHLGIDQVVFGTDMTRPDDSSTKDRSTWISGKLDALESRDKERVLFS